MSYSWQPKTDMPTGRTLLGVAALSGVVYCAGGNAGGALDTHEAYDTAADSWSTKAVMPVARYGHKMAAATGYVFSFGGHTDAGGPFPGVIVASTDRYDPAGNSWSGMTAMPNAQQPGCAILVGGVIYVIGGNDVTRNLTDMNQAYSVAGNSWTAKAVMPAPTARFAAFAIGQYIYCVGGSTNAVYRYDTVGNSWSTMGNAPYTNTGTGATYNGFGYAVPHGVGGSGTMYRYDPSTDSWSTDAPVNQTLQDFSMVTADTMYKFGGSLAGGRKDVERYTQGGQAMIDEIG